MPIDLSRFQTYRKHQRSESNVAPSVTIQNTGAITVNEVAWQLYGDAQPEAFQLLYNTEDKTVGLLPASREDPDAYKINEVGARHSVNARRFVDAYDIPRGRQYSYTPEFDPESGLLFFQARGENSSKAKTKK